ncbi:MAG TPA: ATP-binding protein [Chitinophagaceae bacterium]|nr:ATP-binding protein [Chitinophagaceae bacterium]
MDIKIILVICASIFFVGVIIVLFGFIIQYQKRNLDFRAEKKIMQSAFEQELLNTQLDIQEQTLKRISQEIHDNIGQVLSLAKLYLATTEAGNSDVVKERINESKELIATAIQDLRNLSKSLDTDAVSAIGLYRAVQNKLDFIEKAGFHKTHLDLEGTFYKLEPEAELIIFRVLQEALNNIIKHAQAKNIMVKFNYQPEQLSIKISDDGVGFDLSQLQYDNNEFGLGIKNMHNRAKLVNANFFMESSLGEGTTIYISIKR